jgi:hypothetical protein
MPLPIQLITLNFLKHKYLMVFINKYRKHEDFDRWILNLQMIKYLQ